MPRDRRRQNSPALSDISIADAADARAQADRHWEILWAKRLLIPILTLLAYLPAIRGGFIWDDDTFLTENPLIPAANGLWRFWFSTEAPDYFPLTSTTLWLEWRLWGMNASGYHLTNVLLHAGSALILWRVLARLGLGEWVAWISAAIFALHPVNVESVAWITERKNTLPMIFYLLSLLLYLRFEDDGERRWYGWALASFFLALLSKTSVIMQPFVLLLFAWMRRRKIESRDCLRALPFFLMAVILGLVTMWFQRHRAIGGDVIRTDDFLSRTAIAGRAVWFYLGKAIAPVQLSFVYPRWPEGANSAAAWIPLLLLAVVFIVLLWKRRAWGFAPLAGLGYFVLTLAPVLGFVNIYFMRYSLVADHWQYFSIPGIIALLVWSGDWFLKRTGAHGARAAIAVSLLVALFAISYRQAAHYQNAGNLWRATIAVNPDCWLARNNLGNLLRAQGNSTEAVENLRIADRLEPNDYHTQYNLANALSDNGETRDAIAYYRKSLAAKPDYADAWINLGNALDRDGSLGEAMQCYRNAILHAPAGAKTNPRLALAHNNLGNCLARTGNLPESVKEFKSAIEANPLYGEAHSNLANALVELGRFAEALPLYEKAISLDPENAKIRRNQAIAIKRARGM